MSYQVIPWTWRDGTVHLEMYLVTFSVDESEFLTHLDSPSHTDFESACGLSYWGRGSATGIGDTKRIDCVKCREILRDLSFAQVA